MIDPANVSAVLVTRGDVPMDQILESISDAGIEDIVVWDNSERELDLSCYGRYEAIREAKHDLIFHQDDDLISPILPLLEQYDPVRDRYVIVANNRIDESWPLTAIGSVFHRDLADCFQDYTDLYGFDNDFFRVCDVVFAYRNAMRRVSLGYRDLPWQTAPNSMYFQEGHSAVRERARRRVYALPNRTD